MRKTPTILLIAFSLFSTSLCWSQIHQTNHFRSADGLGTDIIKSITQDSIGFVWIGTDDGLFRYNGTKFQRYPEAASSKFFKDFYTTSDNRILAVHDLGIIEIKPGVHKVEFDEFLPGSRTLTDSALWYPKSVYEDAKGYLWIAEPQSVVRYRNGKWKRFKFSAEYNSSSFVRSFLFYEKSKDELLIVSNTGLFSSYRYSDESITKVYQHPGTIYTINQIGDTPYIGTEAGLFELILSPFIKVESIDIENLHESWAIRDILQIDKEHFMICSEQENTSIIQKDNKAHIASTFFNINTFVNQAYECADGTLWLSTNKGVFVYNQSTFEKIPLNDLNTYIECMIIKPKSDEMYVMNKGSIYLFDTEKRTSKRLFGNSEDYFLSGASSPQGYMLVSSAFDLMSVQDDQVKLTRNMREFGRYIFHVFADNQGDFWVGQEASPGVKKVDPKTLEFIEYGVEKGLPYEISAITERNDQLIVTSSHPTNYLFVKSKSDTIFHNISKPFPSGYNNGVTIETIAATDSAYWLGTNFGLFKYSNSQIEKFLIAPALDNNAVRMLQWDGVALWIGTTTGLIKYNLKTNDYAVFTENSGLPVNTVNRQCFAITESNVWVGTSQGIAVSPYQKNDTLRKTRQPQITSISVNGNDYIPNHTNTFKFHSAIKLTFSSLTYPTSDLQFSYRLNAEDNWSSPSVHTEVILNQIKDGDYDFQVKAQRLGNYGWSDPQSFKFTVNRPFYNLPIFYLLVTLIFGFAILATLTLTKRFEKQRQLQLRKMVEERTTELENIKENLEVAVKERTSKLEQTLKELQNTQNQLIQAEKMASLGVLTAGIAHEINNPVNYLKGGLYSLDKLIIETEKLKEDPEAYEQLQEVMSFMKLGMDRITHIVNGLGRYSRKGSENMLPCNIHEIIDNSLLILEHELKGKLEVVKMLNAKQYTILGDEGTLHQLFVNIVTNAIHATSEFNQLIIKTYNADNKKLTIEIQDHGSGIPREIMDKLFDPFYTTKAPGVGTGLGLFIAKRVVSEHEGTIDFSSEIDVGTTVFITFNIT